MRYPKYISIEFEDNPNWLARIVKDEYVHEEVYFDGFNSSIKLYGSESYPLEDLKASDLKWHKVTEKEYQEMIIENYIKYEKEEIEMKEKQLQQMKDILNINIKRIKSEKIFK